MFQAFMRALGRAAVAVLAALWHGFVAGISAIFMPTFHAVGRAVAYLVTATLVVGGFYALVVLNPGLANQILQLAILIGLVYAGWRYLTRPRNRPQRRRAHD